MAKKKRLRWGSFSSLLIDEPAKDSETAEDMQGEPNADNDVAESANSSSSDEALSRDAPAVADASPDVEVTAEAPATEEDESSKAKPGDGRSGDKTHDESQTAGQTVPDNDADDEPPLPAKDVGAVEEEVPSPETAHDGNRSEDTVTPEETYHSMATETAKPEDERGDAGPTKVAAPSDDSLYTSAPVKLLVGRRSGSSAIFYAHRSILAHSPTLQQQLRDLDDGCQYDADPFGDDEHDFSDVLYKDDGTNLGAIVLPDMDPPAMHAVLAYLYDRYKARDDASARAAGQGQADNDASAFRKRVQLYVHARLLRLDGLADAVASGLSPSAAAAWPAVLSVGQWVQSQLPAHDAWFVGFVARCIEHAAALDRRRLVSDEVLDVFRAGGPFAVTLYRLLAEAGGGRAGWAT